jgi:predicted outer membrane protein
MVPAFLLAETERISEGGFSMKTNHLLALAATLSLAGFAADAGAHDKTWRDQLGSNSLSDTPRAENSPGVVTTPPNGGVTNGAMSTEDSGGNAMAKRDHFDTFSGESASGNMNDTNMRRSRHAEAQRDWSNRESNDEDRVVYHSASAPPSDEHFANYGEDLPALRGIQLEMALNRLHHINQKEIEMAKLAETKAKSANVLNLAHRIRADHEALEAKVKAIADKRNISLKSYQPATYEVALRDRLESLPEGREFETAFLRVNERGHDEAARDLRMVRNNLRDSEVRDLINQALPQMAAHTHLPNQSPKARASSEGGDLGE